MALTSSSKLTFPFFGFLFYYHYYFKFTLCFWIDTLCSELDQERKTRYAIQQKLKGNFIWSRLI